MIHARLLQIAQHQHNRQQPVVLLFGLGQVSH